MAICSRCRVKQSCQDGIGHERRHTEKTRAENQSRAFAAPGFRRTHEYATDGPGVHKRRVRHRFQAEHPGRRSRGGLEAPGASEMAMVLKAPSRSKARQVPYRASKRCHRCGGRAVLLPGRDSKMNSGDSTIPAIRNTCLRPFNNMEPIGLPVANGLLLRRPHRPGVRLGCWLSHSPARRKSRFSSARPSPEAEQTLPLAGSSKSGKSKVTCTEGSVAPQQLQEYLATRAASQFGARFT